MAALLEAARDLLDEVVDLFGELLGEGLLALAAVGLGSLVWWGFQRSPYLTASIVAGVLLFAGYGVVALIRLHRELPVGKLGMSALATAGVLALLLFLA